MERYEVNKALERFRISIEDLESCKTRRAISSSFELCRHYAVPNFLERYQKAKQITQEANQIESKLTTFKALKTNLKKLIFGLKKLKRNGNLGTP